jgi:hypothetical protein
MGAHPQQVSSGPVNMELSLTIQKVAITTAQVVKYFLIPTEYSVSAVVVKCESNQDKRAGVRRDIHTGMN